MLRPEVATARTLRRDMSLPEVLLWQRLRGDKAGLKFRRQHPIGPYVVDFYCAAARFVVEIDGEAHNRGNRPARDCARDAFLGENGHRILRVSAQRILHDPTRLPRRSSLTLPAPSTICRKRQMVPLPVPGRIKD